MLVSPTAMAFGAAALRAVYAAPRRKSGTSRSFPVTEEDRQRCSTDVQLDFERQGFLKVPAILKEEEMATLSRAIEELQSSEKCALSALQHQVRVQFGAVAASQCTTLAACRKKLAALEKRGEVSFLQYFNLHRLSEELRRIAMSPRFSFWATRLLGVPRVRLYQDALFVKRPGDGATDWHSDLGLAPFDTNSFLTFWLPLTAVPPRGGSSLVYAIGSHRDFALPFHGDLDEDLTGRYKLWRTGSILPGDASIHHGWTLHSAAAAPSSGPLRVAWTLGFVADGARLHGARGGPAEDAVSYEPWIGDCGRGAVVDHPMVPLLPLVDD
ncbi:Fe2OG dioxygenase domain-containing protein [Durusdinium trenchii]|uniref:Fe2OG dioxygenase domain-containing protein n=1 Tax=Durusdinium trenchii TaxID=1381693 RepID=A0ABP0IVD6_9DINO